MSSFANLFVPADLQEAVSGRSWLAAMLDAERALATAGAGAGVVPDEEASAIAAACTVDAYEWDHLLDEARQAGTVVEPLVRAIVARVGEDTGRWVHFGATSQDVMDTAAMLVTRRALVLVEGELSRLADACAALAKTHRDTPMAGRTLLQQAVPTTFGLKAAGWLTAVLDAAQPLGELHDHGLRAQLGGAAGTLSALGADGPEVVRLYAHELDLVEPALPWHTNRVRVAEIGAALAIAAGVVAKIALDVLLLAQTEVGEVRESGSGGSSSAMPHKRNPVGAVTARACWELARAHAWVLTGALVQEHERAAGAWQAEWEALSGTLAATGAAAAALTGSLASLEVDIARMRANVDASGGQLLSERLALVLTEKIGRTAARAALRDAAVRAGESGRSFGDEVADLDTGLTAEEIEAVLDPLSYLGSAGVFVDRALARYANDRRDR